MPLWTSHKTGKTTKSLFLEHRLTYLPTTSSVDRYWSRRTGRPPSIIPGSEWSDWDDDRWVQYTTTWSTSIDTVESSCRYAAYSGVPSNIIIICMPSSHLISPSNWICLFSSIITLSTITGVGLGNLQICVMINKEQGQF